MQRGVDAGMVFGRQLGKTSAPIQGLCIRRGFFMPARNEKSPDRFGAFVQAREKERATPEGAVTPKGDARSQM
jgi:hypothetical protein